MTKTINDVRMCEQPVNDCKNPESYREICICCNKCGRYSKKEDNE